MGITEKKVYVLYDISSLFSGRAKRDERTAYESGVLLNDTGLL